jgi:hypothetical protein
MSATKLTDELLGGVPSILIRGKPQPNTLAANRIMAEALHEIISLRARLHKISGWRESDWPEWFDARTARAIAEWVAQE